MKHLSLLVPSLVLVTVIACTPSDTTERSQPAIVPPPKPVYDVSWRRLVSDRRMVSVYTGQTVRFHLLREETQVEDRRTLKVRYGDILMPPVLVITLLQDVKESRIWVISGTCETPVVDSVRRGPGIDYWVQISNATAVPTE